MNVNLNMFCILCLCIILCNTSKASENLTFKKKQSHSVECFVVIIICFLDAIYKYQRLNCDVPEEVSVTFDADVDLNDNAIGRSHYEWFYSQ